MKQEIDDKITRLPKWAQRHIQVMEQNMDRLSGIVRDLSADKPTGIKCTSLPDTDHPFYLPKWTHVEFTTSTGYIDFSYNKDMDTIDCYTTSLIKVQPIAANCVRLEVVK